MFLWPYKIVLIFVAKTEKGEAKYYITTGFLAAICTHAVRAHLWFLDS